MPQIGSFFYKPKKRETNVTAKRWNIFSIIRKVIGKTCMALGAMLLFSIILSTILVVTLGNKAPPLPDKMVLVLRIENGIVEVNAVPGLLDPFPESHPTVRGVVEVLDYAAKDDRVEGLVVSYQGGVMGVAHVQELRSAIFRFRETGKFTKIYSPSYMDGSMGMSRYYFASAFEEIWMQPVGLLSVSGINAELPFAKAILDKVGVRAQFEQREEYKSAMETFTRDTISPESKETLASLFGNVSTKMISDIANDRGLALSEITPQVDKGVLTGEEALSSQLIDRLDYSDVLISEIEEALNIEDEESKVQLVSMSRYYGDMKKQQKLTAKKDTSKTKVALIYVNGTIVDSSNTPGAAVGGDIAEAITDAYKDEDIKAIVVRVDSPGGSPTASETIRRALAKAQAEGKKVIVSMGTVAASGGYWVSTDADKIYALPGTLTGSIGVIMGKFELSGLWEKIGIEWDGVKVGRNANFWSMHKPFSDTAEERLNILIDDVYAAFIRRVSEGRKMSPEQVRSVAKGRAWTGEQAKANGLVDELGGLDVALDGTAQMLGLKNRDSLNVVRIPRELTKIEQLIEILEGEVSLSPFMKTVLSFQKRFDNAAHLSRMNTMAYDPLAGEVRR